jgi:2-polyprenyl-3-methyl-5-hydroxy-6-metoxy-1,4-benzoquinol methylase
LDSLKAEYNENKEMKMLLIGCGNSTLGFDLHKEGFTNIDNIDFSDNVIKRMIDKY